MVEWLARRVDENLGFSRRPYTSIDLVGFSGGLKIAAGGKEGSCACVLKGRENRAE